jgi:threonine/homoserine/homoserine lactone efflux protein
MSATEWTALFVFCTAMSFSPGPNTTLSTALAANHGLRRALRFCLAVPAGWVLLMLGCGLGLGALILGVPALRWGVKLLGVSYMLWLAWKLSGAAQLAQVDARKLDVSFLAGMGMQFLNIKAWMLALAIVAGWVAGREDATARTLMLLPIMVAYGFFSNLTYAVAGSMLRHWLAHGRRLLVFNRCMAVALLATVVWLLNGLRQGA